MTGGHARTSRSLSAPIRPAHAGRRRWTDPCRRHRRHRRSRPRRTTRDRSLVDDRTRRRLDDLARQHDARAGWAPARRKPSATGRHRSCRRNPTGCLWYLGHLGHGPGTQAVGVLHPHAGAHRASREADVAAADLGDEPRRQVALDGETGVDGQPPLGVGPLLRQLAELGQPVVTGVLGEAGAHRVDGGEGEDVRAPVR